MDSLENGLNKINHIVRTVDEETSGHAIPVIGFSVDLQKISGHHVHRSLWRILDGTHIWKFSFSEWVLRSKVIDRLMHVRVERMLVVQEAPERDTIDNRLSMMIMALPTCSG